MIVMRRRYRGFRGLGAVTASQLQNQTPGVQPSFITGSYPNATWDTYNSFNNGYGVYLPYNVIALCGTTNPANCGQFAVLNQNVTNQFSALLLQAFPAMAAGESTQSSYCAANPSAMVCAGSGVPPNPAAVYTPAQAAQFATPPPSVSPAPVPVSPASAVPAGTASSPVPISSASVPASYSPAAAAGATYMVSGGGSGFDLSSVPWWAWAGTAAIGLYMVTK